jgi:hypothetical protein
VWQGSDFDINAELAEQEVQLCTLNVADKLNETSVFLPFVAKKYSIENHTHQTSQLGCDSKMFLKRIVLKI